MKTMPVMIDTLLEQYVEEVRKIYGISLKSVILYGSYARGDFRPDSDIDIMILVDLADMDIEKYHNQLSWSTYDFNESHDTDIRTIANSDLRAAEVLIREDEYRGANNRAYYAIYHAISAVHALDGKSYKRHKDTLANFNKDYVRTEIFPKSFGRID